MGTVRNIILSVIACVVGAVLLIGGVAFTKAASDYYTLDFDNYDVMPMAFGGNGSTPKEVFDAGRITYPRYVTAWSPFDFDASIMDCYLEVQEPCFEYAASVAKKYDNNADLTFTTENTGKLFTIKFTGTGYPENGEPEPLERTYIFDIEGANVNKLPRLVNRADFIGY